MKVRVFAAVVAVITAVGGALALSQVAGATVAATCPSNPAAGSTISGNLDVTGTCVLNGVTVTGSVTVESTGKLELDSSTVYGSVTVAGGELDAGATLGTGVPNGKGSIVRGNVNYAGSDMDFIGSQLKGSLNVTGTGHQPRVCGSVIQTGVEISGIPTGHTFRVGDPDSDNGSCSADVVKNPSGANANVSIHDNVGVVEIEGGAVYGNVSAANNTTVEVEGNYIRGNLSCGTNANVTDKDGTTANPNAVRGTNTC